MASEDAVRCFKADKARSQKINEMWNRADGKLREADKLAKEYGGKACYTHMGFFTRMISGFQFKTPPDAKLWKRVPGTTDGWAPKRVKAMKPLHSKMEELRDNFIGDVAKLIGFQQFQGGGWFRNPGVCIAKGVAYIKVRGTQEKLKGCVRISDLAYEKATSKPDNRKPAKKLAAK